MKTIDKFIETLLLAGYEDIEHYNLGGSIIFSIGCQCKEYIKLSVSVGIFDLPYEDKTIKQLMCSVRKSEIGLYISAIKKDLAKY